MKNRPHTKEMIELARKMKAEGHKRCDIVIATGMSKSRVSVHTADIRSHWVEPALAEETKAAIRELRRAGMSYQEIGEKVGVSHTAASRFSRDVPSSCRRGKRKDPWARKRHLKIATLFAEGMSYAQLSDRFGYTKNHIGVIIWKVKHQWDRTPIAERRAAA